jgi:dienelactone hydrolase
VLHEDTPEGLAQARVAFERLGSSELMVELHALSPLALESDRHARVELDRALERLARRPLVDRSRLAALGFGRGGTLAFLLGCTRDLAAVVDVEGSVLYPALSAEHPIQPLELALNFGGAFLGVFSSASGRVGREELELLRQSLSSAARPFDIVVGPRTLDEELWPRVLAFLGEHLAAEPS